MSIVMFKTMKFLLTILIVIVNFLPEFTYRSLSNLQYKQNKSNVLNKF